MDNSTAPSLVFTDLPEGFLQSTLFSDTFSTALRKGHPAVRDGKLTQAEFFRHRHALITLRGDIEEVLPLKDREKGRTFSYGTWSFTSVAWLVEKTDLILTAPSRLLNAFEGHFDMKVIPCPVELKPLRLKMMWHARTDADPLFAWIRKIIREVCKEESSLNS